MHAFHVVYDTLKTPNFIKKYIFFFIFLLFLINRNSTHIISYIMDEELARTYDISIASKGCIFILE